MAYQKLKLILVFAGVISLTTGCSGANESEDRADKCFGDGIHVGQQFVGNHRILVSSIGIGSFTVIRQGCRFEESHLPIRVADEKIRAQLGQLIPNRACENYAVYQARVSGKVASVGGAFIADIDEIQVGKKLGSSAVLEAFNLNEEILGQHKKLQNVLECD